MTLYVISGAAGMPGNELSRQLYRHNYVIGFDNFFCSSVHTIADLLGDDNFEFHEWDINDAEQMMNLKNRVIELKTLYSRIVYINCAAIVHTEYFYHVNSTFETNVIGMKSLLEQAIDVGADTYINCSTSEVYSMQSWSEDGVKESDYISMSTAEHSQRTSYAAGKLMTEFFMKDAVDKGLIKGCSLRFANVYSKNELQPKHIIPHIINELITKNGVTLLENSKINKRTFLHNIDSCAAVIELINTNTALDGSIYNVATDEEVSIIELVNICAQKLGIDNPEIVFEGYRENDPVRRVLNTDKIRTKTNWKPTISLMQGIEMIVEDKKKCEF